MASTTDPLAPVGKYRLPVRNLIAASAGNAVEWYDWTIFGLFSTIFATQYFPSEEPGLAYINTAATFAVAFFFRPVGGWLIGRVADRRGRKPALLVSISLMCGGSLIIAFSPTFETIGWASPLLLLTARIAQGVSAGGDVGISYAYLYEIAPEDRKGRFSSFTYISTGSATLVASLLGYWITHSLDAHAVASWGWRVPFVIGAVLGVLVLWLRSAMTESSEYRSQVAGGEAVANPLLATLRQYPRSVVQIIGMVGGSTVVYYTFTNALKSYATTPTDQGGTIGASEPQTFLALSVSLVGFVALQYPFGALADRMGRRNLLLASAAIFAVVTVPLSKLLSASSVSLIAVFGAGLCLCAMTTSVMPAVLADLMPPHLRGVGIGAWCNVAVALFGGTAPLILTALTAEGHAAWFFWYIVGMCALAFFVLLSVPDERREVVAAYRAAP